VKVTAADNRKYKFNNKKNIKNISTFELLSKQKYERNGTMGDNEV
jgi:hypothetical protein